MQELKQKLKNLWGSLLVKIKAASSLCLHKLKRVKPAFFAFLAWTSNNYRYAKGQIALWRRFLRRRYFPKVQRFSIGLQEISSLRESLADILLSSFVLNILGLVLPLSLLHIYDRILPNKSTGTMTLLLLGVMGALLMETILNYCRSYITGWIGVRFEHRAACLGLERMLSTSLHEFEKEGAGIHVERINALGTVRDFYAGQALLAVFDLPFCVVYLALVGFLGGWTMMVPLLLLAGFVYCANLAGRKLRLALEDRTLSDDRRFNFLIEMLDGIHSVKSMSIEAQMVRRYERLQEACALGNYDVALENANAIGVSSFFNQTTAVAVAAVGSIFVIHGDMTTGALAACSMLAGRAMVPLQKSLGVWTRFQSFLLAHDRIEELFALPTESSGQLPPMPQAKGRLTLDHVSFRFSEKTPWVVDDLSIEVAEDECVGIIGNNGSGKSTLLALMQGALQPTSGRVLVDGVDVLSYDPASVREQIAHLPQTGILFHGTILENLTMFRPALNEQALDTAGLLGLDEVVSTMPMGYETLVGSGADDPLPRGIRQRIVIARGLVDNPRYILFDEANSSVDGMGDHLLRLWLERVKGKRTLVLVTHRPSLLTLADRVFDFQDGRLSQRPGKPAS